MGKIVKRVMTGAVICGALGVGMITTGYALGEKSPLSAIASATPSHRDEKRVQKMDFGEADPEQSYALEVSIDTGKAIIESGSAFSLTTNCPERLTANMNDGVLSIDLQEKDTEFWDWGWNIFSWFDRREADYVKVTVPREVMLTHADLETNTGMISIKNLSAQELAIKVDTGMVAAKDLKIDESTGIDVGTGNVDIEGVMGKRVKVDVDTGNAELEAEQVQDFGYSADISTGIAVINGSRFFGGRNIQNENAEVFFELSCNTGRIKLETSD